MPTHQLQQHIAQLQQQLIATPSLDRVHREDLEALIAELQLQLQQESLALDSNLVDGFNLAVERFEVEHPTLTGTLRNLLQTLANMGI